MQVLLVVVALAGLGALAGVLWEWVWTAPVGVVIDHRWVPAGENGLQAEFSGTGWYVVVATVAGLVGGVLVALVARRVPLLTLVAVVVGSVLGAWLMLQVGSALGPPDPTPLAHTAKDGTRLPDDLQVTPNSPWISLPAGALVGLALVFIGLSGRSREPRHKTRAAR